MGDHAVEVWKNWGSYRLDPGHDLESLRYLLTQDSPQVALLAIEWKKFLGQLVSIPGYLREIANEQSLSEEAASIEDNEFIIHLRNTPDENKKSIIGEFLREHVASSLQLMKEEMKLDQSFASLGVDSLMAISLRDYIQKKLGYELPAIVIFTYPTINSLGEFILTQVIKIAPSEIPLEENNNEIIADNISAEEMDNLLDSLNEDNLHD